MGEVAIACCCLLVHHLHVDLYALMVVPPSPRGLYSWGLIFLFFVTYIRRRILAVVPPLHYNLLLIGVAKTAAGWFYKKTGERHSAEKKRERFEIMRRMWGSQSLLVAQPSEMGAPVH